MATVFEAKVGPGKLIFSSIDLKKELENRPVARQLKYSLLEYMKSADFDPAPQLDYAALKKFIYAEQATKAGK